MLFCTISFIEFLAITFLLYLILTFLKVKYPLTLSIKGKRYSVNYNFLSVLMLCLASVYFYSSWKEDYVILLLISIVVNFFLGMFIEKGNRSKALTIIGVLFNIGLLAYYKYTFFIVDNFNFFFNANFEMSKIILPLGISFFTFQQIAYIVDIYKGESKSSSFLKYFLFVSFFPQLIAGPIVHHKSMTPQFDNINDPSKLLGNIRIGIFRFTLGLFKKLVIADTFAYYVSYGFSMDNELNIAVVVLASIGFSLQMYFDFSGYCDMAVGAAKFFNIDIPENFNSPYRSASIREFWQRWHITLSQWLRNYIYFPLGGSRKGQFFKLFNLFITFLIGGLWHGANWTFVIWGALFGVASVVNDLWVKTGIKMNKVLAWSITFVFLNLTPILFRSADLAQAKSMFLSLGVMPQGDISFYVPSIILFFISILFVVFAPNTKELQDRIESSNSMAVTICSSVAISFAAMVSLFFMFAGNTPNFLYFNF